MTTRFLRQLSRLGIIASLTTIALACSKAPVVTQGDVAVVTTYQAEELPEPAAPEPAAEVAKDGFLHLRSEEAPVACAVIDVEILRDSFSENVTVHDISDERRERNPVESSCVFAFGSQNESRAERRERRLHGLRIDVWSDRSYQAADWGTLEANWQHRTGHADRWFEIDGLALASWVDSEHPPDQSLLLRTGDVMFELGYYPPTSYSGSPETDARIEQMAAVILQNLRNAE